METIPDQLDRIEKKLLEAIKIREDSVRVSAFDYRFVVVFWHPESSCFIAVCPLSPGSSASGETRTKAISELETVLSLI